MTDKVMAAFSLVRVVRNGLLLLPGEKIRPRLAVFLSLMIVAGFCLYFRSRHLDLEAALFGLSPEQVALLSTNPGLFLRDFPSGAEESLKSIIFNVYPIALRLGFDVIYVWKMMIGIEIVCLMSAVFYAVRTLFPGSGLLQPAVTAVLMAVGSLLAPDLARFMLPYYGWNYGFAVAGLLLVAALVLRARYFGAALIWVLLFSVHPIVALFSAIFSGAALLHRTKRDGLVLWRRLAVPALMAVAGGGAWLHIIAGQGTISGGQVDPQWFVALTRAQNYHWFPFYLGVFGSLHHAHLLPLLSTLALGAWALGRVATEDRSIAADAVTGLGALLITAGIGLFISEFVAVPALIKLSLHRAGQSAAAISGLFIINALWRDLYEGGPVERALAAMLVLLPFQSDVGLLPGLVGLRVGLAAVRGGSPRAWPMSVAAAVAVSAFSLLLIIIYWIVGLSAQAPAGRYLGLSYSLVLVGIGAAAWPLIGSIKTTHAKSLAQGLGAVLFTVVLVAGAFSSSKFSLLAETSTRARARNALQAQLWARQNTPAGSLFMVDPSLGYMWRDKSHRPSFGTVREWLLISIMYNSRADLLEEGFRRYEAIGASRPTYLLSTTERSMPTLLARLQGDAEKAFDSLDKDAFSRLSATYGIDYVVFDRQRSSRTLPLTVVYENPSFAIGALR